MPSAKCLVPSAKIQVPSNKNLSFFPFKHPIGGGQLPKNRYEEIVHPNLKKKLCTLTDRFGHPHMFRVSNQNSDQGISWIKFVFCKNATIIDVTTLRLGAQSFTLLSTLRDPTQLRCPCACYAIFEWKKLKFLLLITRKE